VGAIEAGSTISINYEFIELAQELFGIEEINIEIPRLELAVTDIHMGYHLKAGVTAGFVIDLNGTQQILSADVIFMTTVFFLRTDAFALNI